MVIAAAAVSALRTVEWASSPPAGKPQQVISVTRGCLVIWWYPQPSNAPGWNAYTHHNPWQWLPGIATSPDSRIGYIECPLWIILLPLMILVALIAPRKRRSHPISNKESPWQYAF